VPLSFSTSGVAVIPAGAASVTFNPSEYLSTEAFLLLTPCANLAGRDLWYTTVVGTEEYHASEITIHMSSPRQTEVRVSWLLLDK
jgi:hypothetical protein